ncbi:unnamed protein product [Ectocarpus sp. 12 AP-2014]
MPALLQDPLLYLVPCAFFPSASKSERQVECRGESLQGGHVCVRAYEAYGLSGKELYRSSFCLLGTAGAVCCVCARALQEAEFQL